MISERRNRIQVPRGSAVELATSGQSGMARKFESRPDRWAGPLLASTLVMLLGGVGVAVVVAVGGGDPLVCLVLIGCLIFCVLIFGYLLRAVPSNTLSSQFGWTRSRQARPENEYSPEAIRTRHRYGTNHPPTVEEIRDMKDGLHNWVPSRDRRQKPSGGREKRTED